MSEQDVFAANIEKVLRKSVPGFEALAGCEQLSAGASRRPTALTIPALTASALSPCAARSPRQPAAASVVSAWTPRPRCLSWRAPGASRSHA